MRKIVLAIVVMCSSTGILATISTTQSSGDYVTDLSALDGVIKTQGLIKEICSEAFPELRTQNEAAYTKWRSRYKPFLQEIQLRMTDMLLADAHGDTKAMTDTFEYINTGFQEVKKKLRTMYAKDGQDAFMRNCKRFPQHLSSEKANIEKYYPEHVETIRKVKLK